jgi:hypothetical protein
MGSRKRNRLASANRRWSPEVHRMVLLWDLVRSRSVSLGPQSRSTLSTVTSEQFNVGLGVGRGLIPRRLTEKPGPV